MIPISERAKSLSWDLLVFTEMLLYWPVALGVMKPAQWLDRRLGTSLFPGLDRTMRRIADL